MASKTPHKMSRTKRSIAKLGIKPSRIRRQLTRVGNNSLKHANRFIVRRLNNLREARRNIIIWFAVVSLIIIGAASQSMILANSYMRVATAAGGTYTEGIIGTISTLNPVYANSAVEVAISRLLFSSLYRYDRTGTLTPDVALKTAVDDTGQVYTVTLRSDAKWQDGEPLTADDVVYTIKLIQDPTSSVPTALSTTWQGVTVKKISQYQVQFSLPAYAGFMAALTFPILPEHILGHTQDDAVASAAFSTNPVGSGPFQFRILQSIDSVSGEKSIHMIANPDYYGVPPKLERFAIHSYASEDHLETALHNSEVTAAVGVDAAQLHSNMPRDYVASDYLIDDGVYLIFNTAQPELSDLNVRRALQLAVNTSAIRRSAGGDVKALDIPIISAALQAKFKAPEQDVTRADALLDKAGWKLTGEYRTKGKETLAFSMKTISTPQFKRVAKTIVDQLKQIGVKVDLTTIDADNRSNSFVQSVLQPRDYDLLLYELTVGSEPDQFAYWHSSQRGIDGYNFANYSSAVADAALSTARDRLNVDLRTAKYETFVQQWLDDAPAIGLYQQSVTYAHTKNSHAVDPHFQYVTASDRYNDIADWTVNQKKVYSTP